MKTAPNQTGGTSHVRRIFGGCVHCPRPHRRGLFGAQQREGQRPFGQWQRVGVGQRTQRKRKREREQVAASRSSSRGGNPSPLRRELGWSALQGERREPDLNLRPALVLPLAFL